MQIEERNTEKVALLMPHVLTALKMNIKVEIEIEIKLSN